MKAKKIIIGLMLVGLMLNVPIQLSAGENLSRQDKMEGTILLDENLSDHLMVEAWMYDLESWPELKVEIEQKTDFQEELLEVESWMKSPFEAGVVEEDLILEPWMSRVL